MPFLCKRASQTYNLSFWAQLHICLNTPCNFEMYMFLGFRSTFSIFFKLLPNHPIMFAYVRYLAAPLQLLFHGPRQQQLHGTGAMDPATQAGGAAVRHQRRVGGGAGVGPAGDAMTGWLGSGCSLKWKFEVTIGNLHAINIHQLVIDLKVLVRSFHCESRACNVGNPRESFFFEFAKVTCFFA